VDGLIAGADAERLARLHADHVRDIAAILLIEQSGGAVAAVTRRHAFKVDQHVRQRLVVVHDHRFFLQFLRRALAAGLVLDRCHLGRRANELHDALDCPAAERRLGTRFFDFFVPASNREREQTDPNDSHVTSLDSSSSPPAGQADK
jgi:hypothetical protein